MTPRYTPGPWRVDAARINEPALVYVGELSSHSSIADVFSPTGFRATVNANARLVAAAPDLVEACRVLVAQLEGFRAAAIDARIWDRDDGGAIDVGRAALRKAGVEP